MPPTEAMPLFAALGAPGGGSGGSACQDGGGVGGGGDGGVAISGGFEVSCGGGGGVEWKRSKTK